MKESNYLVLTDSQRDYEFVIGVLEKEGYTNTENLSAGMWDDSSEQVLLAESETKSFREIRKNEIDSFTEEGENFYSYVIADTNPSIGAINQNAFFMADSIILVSNSSYDSIMGKDIMNNNELALTTPTLRYMYMM